MDTPRRLKPEQTARMAIVLAALAVVIAVFAVLRSLDDTGPATLAAVSAEGSDRTVCGAFVVVRKSVSDQTKADLGPDPAARAAVAANARLAALGGGLYLLSRVDGGTRPELADAVRGFADNLMDIAMNQLQGVPNSDPAVLALLSDAQAASDRITVMCA